MTDIYSNIASNVGNIGENYRAGFATGASVKQAQTNSAIQAAQELRLQEKQKLDSATSLMQLLKPAATEAAKQGQDALDKFTSSLRSNPMIQEAFAPLGLDLNNLTFHDSNGLPVSKYRMDVSQVPADVRKGFAPDVTSVVLVSDGVNPPRYEVDTQNVTPMEAKKQQKDIQKADVDIQKTKFDMEKARVELQDKLESRGGRSIAPVTETAILNGAMKLMEKEPYTLDQALDKMIESLGKKGFSGTKNFKNQKTIPSTDTQAKIKGNKVVLGGEEFPIIKFNGLKGIKFQGEFKPIKELNQ